MADIVYLALGMIGIAGFAGTLRLIERL